VERAKRLAAIPASRRAKSAFRDDPRAVFLLEVAEDGVPFGLWKEP
jgi:hypothetical protein